MSDPLDNLFRAASEDDPTRLQARIDSQRRLQNRAKTIRRRLRRARWTLMAGGLGLFFAGGYLEMRWLGFVGILMLFAVFPVWIALFFMGGWMPDKVRYFLSEREKRLLDD
jgi:hypothetical protein